MAIEVESAIISEAAAKDEDEKENQRCPICAKDIVKRNLLRHVEDLHTVVQGGVGCTKDYCKMQFETWHEMYAHRVTCIYRCPVCSKVIDRNGRVEGHKKKCH